MYEFIYLYHKTGEYFYLIKRMAGSALRSFIYVGLKFKRMSGNYEGKMYKDEK